MEPEHRRWYVVCESEVIRRERPHILWVYMKIVVSRDLFLIENTAYIQVFCGILHFKSGDIGPIADII